MLEKAAAPAAVMPVPDLTARTASSTSVRNSSFWSSVKARSVGSRLVKKAMSGSRSSLSLISRSRNRRVIFSMVHQLDSLGDCSPRSCRAGGAIDGLRRPELVEWLKVVSEASMSRSGESIGNSGSGLTAKISLDSSPWYSRVGEVHTPSSLPTVSSQSSSPSSCCCSSWDSVMEFSFAALSLGSKSLKVMNLFRKDSLGANMYGLCFGPELPDVRTLLRCFE